MRPIFYDWAEAADYVGLSEKNLKCAVRHGHGPTYVKPTPKRVLFTPADLDAWRDGWTRIEPSAKRSTE
jgi:hypothetical protein